MFNINHSIHWRKKIIFIHKKFWTKKSLIWFSIDVLSCAGKKWSEIFIIVKAKKSWFIKSLFCIFITRKKGKLLIINWLQNKKKIICKTGQLFQHDNFKIQAVLTIHSFGVHVCLHLHIIIVELFMQ